MHWWCIINLGGWRCHKCGNFFCVLLCLPRQGLSLLQWHRLFVRSCCSGLGHHSCIVRSLFLVGNTSSVAWLWWSCRWCQMVLWLLGDQACDAICSMGCPRCIPIGSTQTRSIWNDGVKVSRVCIDQVKLLGFQYGLLFRLGTFGCDVLCYRWEKGFKEPIQEDHVIKLDLTQTTELPPLMNVVGYVGCSILPTR